MPAIAERNGGVVKPSTLAIVNNYVPGHPRAQAIASGSSWEDDAEGPIIR